MQKVRTEREAIWQSNGLHILQHYCRFHREKVSKVRYISLFIYTVLYLAVAFLSIYIFMKNIYKNRWANLQSFRNIQCWLLFFRIYFKFKFAWPKYLNNFVNIKMFKPLNTMSIWIWNWEELEQNQHVYCPFVCQIKTKQNKKFT